MGSEDELGGPAFGLMGDRLHKFRGITLFRLDDDCRLAWSVTFRELKATELDTYSKPAAAAARP
ncbi:hypothetical protein TSOC_004125 [Tetrabaena socialis]|uniref:Uncharacterized protein n=1 Tax=Tetrabaena socialis TaxID=47790 RepID=A0A2J8A9P7_9CHLO|nr:hypothetical protein TSOC_004125 [Tetrabaena socialis]|eukprot:PNH09257.1 hypothetical protein TSOC_004125 [Tetrabaena socialis]